MHCPGCSTELTAGTAVCGACGRALELICAQCNRVSAVDAAFCAGCGARLEVHSAAGGRGLEGERRTVTVVLSDLSGYTAMGERLDPEDVAELMGSIKRDATRIIESHGGIVNQFVGDEIISLFGLPTVRDDDARRAVSAALELHRRVAELGESVGSMLSVPLSVPLSMHSGIQTGLLIAELRDSRSGVYELTGDTINTAARLLAIAGRSEVVVGDTTVGAIAPYFEIEPAGVHEARGKALPLAAFRVVRPWSNRNRFDTSKARGLTRLTGRGRELARLRDLLDEVATGIGSVVVVEADAGTGKSRLCHDFLDGLRTKRSDVEVLSGRCQAFGLVTSYLPFVHVLRNAFGVNDDNAVEVIAEKANATLTTMDRNANRWLPAYLYLLSALAVDELPAEWAGDELPRILQEAIVGLVEAKASGATIVVYLDDWHWADAASQTTLARLSRAIEALPVMVLITARPSPTLWRNVEIQHLQLGPLSAHDTTLMVGRCFDAHAVESQLAAKIFERTMGNPFFVEEVCSTLIQRGDVLHVEGEAMYSGELEQLEFPATVQSVVLGRVDALAQTTRDALRFASVIGREFTVNVLQQLVASASDIADVLRTLDRLGFVEQIPVTASGRFQFKHVIIQEVTYATLLVRERAAVHARIAEIIERSDATDDADQLRNVEALAHHYRQAGNATKSLRYLEQAGRKAMARFAFADARQHLREAIEESLKLDDTLEQRLHRAALTQLWSAACIFGPSTSQLDLIELAYREAMERDDDAVAIQCRYWISYLHYAIGDQNAAETEIRRLIAAAEPRLNNQIDGQLLAHLGQILVLQRRFDEATEELESGMRLRESSPRTRRPGFGGMASFSIMQIALIAADRGLFAQSHREAERALKSVRGSGERSREASLLITRSMALAFEGEWLRVREAAVGARAIAEYVGAPFHLAFADVIDGYANFQLGARALGLRMMRRGLVAHEQCGAMLAFALSRAYVADALEQNGEYEEAAKLALAALARADVGDRLGDDIARRVLLRCEARLAPDLLASEIARLRLIAVERGSLREEALLELAAAQSYLSVGDGPAAREHSDRAVDAISALEMPWYVAEAESVRQRAEELP